MPNEFEPYHIEVKTGEFTAWEFQPPPSEEPDEVKEEEIIIDEREMLKQQAIEQGFAEGMLRAQEEINAKKEELNALFDLFQKPIQLLDDQLTQELILTFIWLCTHCIGVELSLKPDQLHSLFNEIKSELPALRPNQEFSMHPEDIAWIKQALDEKKIPGLHKILVEDASLNRGDFFLKTEHGEMDGRLHTRFITIFDKYFAKANKDAALKPKV